MPVTSPVLAFTVAIDVLPLLHEPPLVVLERVDVCPTQIEATPVLAARPALTVTVAVLEHPLVVV